MRHIVSVSLIGTLLNDNGFEMIAAACKGTLRSLDISKNPSLTPKTYNLIAVNFRRLECLNVERNFIKDEGCFALLDWTMNNEMEQGSFYSEDLDSRDSSNRSCVQQRTFLQTLKVLNLSQNSLQDKGAFVVAEFIRKTRCLGTLQLHWNKIRAAGSIELANAIKVN